MVSWKKEIFQMNKKLGAIVFYLVLIFLTFTQVLNGSPLRGGDYTSITNEYRNSFSYSAWQGHTNLGQSFVPFLNYAPYNFYIKLVSQVVSNSLLLERLVWWIPFFIISFSSIYLLYRYLFPKNNYYVLAPLIFIFNSYILIILGGGQISGMGLSYAFMPFIFLQFLKMLESKYISFHSILLLGLLLSIQAVFDIRLLYITLFGLSLLFLFFSYAKKRILQLGFIKQILSLFVLPLLMVFLLHAFWILPTLIYRQNPLEDLGAAYTTAEAVEFLSFANFENALGLLHPNWPENIFGKTGFMKPEFLILPILAFSRLFLKPHDNITEKKRNVLFVPLFAFLGLLGAFLAKGANDPFGSFYIWLFEHIPGFVLFRDPTKWYVLIALSYSLLIPYCISQIVNYLESKQKSFFIKILVVSFVSFFIFTIRSVFVGEMNGVLQTKSEFHSYTQLNNYLQRDSSFSRSLWVPSNQRLAYRSELHPVLSTQYLLSEYNMKRLLTKLNYFPLTYLQDLGVRYIIIPEDTEGEIFLDDRMYSEREYEMTVNTLDNIPWLKNVKNFGKIVVYEVPNPKDRFWSENDESKIIWEMITPAHYQIKAKNGTIDGLLVFSEQFSPYWTATYNGRTVFSQKFRSNLNSFAVTNNPATIDVYFQPQKWVDAGLIVSGVSLCIIVALLIITKKRNND